MQNNLKINIANLDYLFNLINEAYTNQPNQQVEVGNNVCKYAKTLTQGKDNSLKLSCCNFPDNKLNRINLYKYCHLRNENGSFVNDIQCCFVAIMAWGGANRKHVASLLEHHNNNWVTLLDDFRVNTITRRDAYQQLFNLRSVGDLPGVGPAFYTKLIYFLRPWTSDHNDIGYIMDQWTSKSINILFQPPIVKLSKPYKGKGGNVLDSNDENIYDVFCNLVDQLTRIINNQLRTALTGHDIETALFSVGGRPPGNWRRYVLQNWAYPRDCK
jgi:hypothetical protein